LGKSLKIAYVGGVKNHLKCAYIITGGALTLLDETNLTCHHCYIGKNAVTRPPPLKKKTTSYDTGFEKGAFDSAKNHKRQRRKRQSVTAKREKSQTPKFV